LRDYLDVVGESERALDEWVLHAIEMDRPSLRVPEARKFVAVTSFTDLGKDHRPDVPLAFRLNILR